MNDTRFDIDDPKSKLTRASLISLVLNLIDCWLPVRCGGCGCGCGGSVSCPAPAAVTAPAGDAAGLWAAELDCLRRPGEREASIVDAQPGLVMVFWDEIGSDWWWCCVWVGACCAGRPIDR